MANPDLAPGALQKQPRGSGLLASRGRTAERKAHEQGELQAALDRDGGGKGKRLCRFPRCEFKAKQLPIDPCHVRRPDGAKHRGMGGNPAGDRTAREWTISFCRGHHGLYDAQLIDVRPQTAQACDGCCDYYAKDKNGRFVLVASERAIGISETRGL